MIAARQAGVSVSTLRRALQVPPARSDRVCQKAGPRRVRRGPQLSGGPSVSKRDILKTAFDPTQGPAAGAHPEPQKVLRAVRYP